MQLDLREVIHVPGASKSFQLQLDLSELEFYGERPISQPIVADGTVTNRADVLTLTGTARSVLDLTCGRCGKAFSTEKVVSLDCLLAAELEDEEHDEFIPLQGNRLDLDELVTTDFVLAMDTKSLCSDDCKGLCDQCGADLNLGPCGCRPEVDPRLAALAQLLDNSN